MIHLPTFPSRKDCVLCELHEQPCVTSRGVPSEWVAESLPPSAGSPCVVMLGMNPGYNEDVANRPFVGPSGRCLREVYLQASGLLEVASVYLFNAVRCTTPIQTPPKKRHYKACWPNTQQDLDDLLRVGHSSHHIVCLGSSATDVAFRMLLGRRSTSLKDAFKVQGTPSPSGPWILYSTFHPSAVLRDKEPARIYPVAEHMSLVFRCVVGDVPLPSLPRVVPPRSPLPHPVAPGATT